MCRSKGWTFLSFDSEPTFDADTVQYLVYNSETISGRPCLPAGGKFICLNDNMNHGTQEAEVIRAVIQDFYESLFPTRSQFELSPEYRNRFLYVSELREWRRTRDIIRVVTYLTLGILILFSLISFWKSEIRHPERYPRLRAIQERHLNSQNV